MKNKKLLLLIGPVLFFFFSCHAPSTSSDNSTTSKKSGVLKFNKHTLMDEQGTHMAAASYLVPEGWEVQDAVQWDINNVALPATANILIENKNRQAAFEGFPNMVFMVNADPDMNEQYPAGSDFYGAEVLNQEPTVIDLIKDYVLPEYRNISGLKIEEEKNISIAESNRQRAKEYKNTNSKSGVIRVEYDEDGKTFEETIYGTITFLPIAQYQQYAFLSMCYGCKTVKGELENSMGIFSTILNSVKLNPKWAVTYNQVMQMALQNIMRNNANYQGNTNDQSGYANNGQSNYGNNNGGMNNANYTGGMNNANYAGAMGGGNYQAGSMGNLSDYITSASGRVDNSMIQSYQNQQQSEDRISEGYSDYMRGNQNFTDPNTGDVYKLSSGYSNAWTDNNGSVVLSNDAGYDPNAGGGSSSWSSLSAGGSTYSSPAATVSSETTSGE